MKYVIDMDGVLAEFNTSFAAQIGHPDIPVDDLTWPKLWDWPQQYVSDEQLANVWRQVHRSETFWESLPCFSWTQETLTLLAHEIGRGHEVYFVTARQGVDAKRQTERWLQKYGIELPTVVVVQKMEKGGIVQDLGADVMIDDKPELLVSAKAAGKESLRLYLQVHPYNKAFAFIANKRYNILPVESPLTVIRSEYVRREIYKSVET